MFAKSGILLLISLVAACNVHAAGVESITYQASLKLIINSIFSGQTDSAKILDTYFKGSFEDTAVKTQAKSVLAQRGKTRTVSDLLHLSTDGDSDYELQVLGINMPDAVTEIRHESARAGTICNWFTYPKKIVSIGYVNKDFNDSLIWPTKLRTLFQYLPVGINTANYPLSSNQIAILETPFAGFKSINSSHVPEHPHVVFIQYSDSRRSSISEIVGYWNVKVKRPAFRVKFVGSRVQGNRHFFNQASFINYDEGKVSTIESYRLVSRSISANLSRQEPPLGQAFIDRRLGPERHYSFAYDGVRLPTEDEVKKILSQSNANQIPPDNRPMIQFLLGCAFILAGAIFWARSKRIS